VATPGGPAGPPTAELCRALAARIHDDVLQSLALCSLQAELSRRLWEAGQPDQALTELTGIGDGLEAAVTALREVMNVLLAAADPPKR
jgi:signal transduction histidine kinase